MSKTDAFPKFVCSDCWQKTEKFHEFHRLVQRVQNNFLNGFIKYEIDENFTDGNEMYHPEPPIDPDPDQEQEGMTELNLNIESDTKLGIKSDMTIIDETFEYDEVVPNNETDSDEAKWGK